MIRSLGGKGTYIKAFITPKVISISGYLLLLSLVVFLDGFFSGGANASSHHSSSYTD